MTEAEQIIALLKENNRLLREMMEFFRSPLQQQETPTYLPTSFRQRCQEATAREVMNRERREKRERK